MILTIEVPPELVRRLQEQAGHMSLPVEEVALIALKIGITEMEVQAPDEDEAQLDYHMPTEAGEAD